MDCLKNERIKINATEPEISLLGFHAFFFLVKTWYLHYPQVPGRACTQQLKWEKKTGHFKTSYQVIFKVSDRVSDLVWWVESNLQPVSKNVSKIVMLYPYNKTVSLLLNTVFETLKLQGLQITYYEKITTNSTVWSWAGSINWVFRAFLLKFCSEGSCQFTLSEPLLQVNPHSVTAPTDFGLQCE